MEIASQDDDAERERAEEVLLSMPDSLVTVLGRSYYAPRGALKWIFDSLEMGSKALVLAHGLVTRSSSGELYVTDFGSVVVRTAAEKSDDAYQWHLKMEAIEKQDEKEWGRLVKELQPSP